MLDVRRSNERAGQLLWFFEAESQGCPDAGGVRPGLSVFPVDFAGVPGINLRRSRRRCGLAGEQRRNAGARRNGTEEWP